MGRLIWDEGTLAQAAGLCSAFPACNEYAWLAWPAIINMHKQGM